MDERGTKIMRASLVALVGNGVLAAGKIAAGLLAGSLAVTGDGIDSSTDVIISLIALVTAAVAAKPSDREHPYGHGRAETLATTVLAFIIMFAAVQLFVTALRQLASGQERALPSPLAVWVTLASILGKLFLALHQSRAGRTLDSSMLRANGRNMRNDVIMSAGVLVGLFGTFVLKLPVLDPIVALAVCLWVAKSALGIFREVNMELMDGSDDEGAYRAVFDAVRAVPGAGNPHRTRVRRIANRLVVDLDIEVDPLMTVLDAHGIAMAVERAIKDRLANVYDVMVHVEPEGVHESGEKFGLCERDLGGGSDGAPTA